MRLRSASSSLPSFRLVGMETCTLQSATNLSEAFFLGLDCHGRYGLLPHLFGPLRMPRMLPSRDPPLLSNGGGSQENTFSITFRYQTSI